MMMIVKIIMIEMIKTMNEISPYIGLSDTFRRRRVDVHTSASGVGVPVSTLGRAHSLGLRVGVGRLEQRRRSNGAASRRSIDEGWGADIEASLCLSRCRCMEQAAYPLWVPMPEHGP